MLTQPLHTISIPDQQGEELAEGQDDQTLRELARIDQVCLFPVLHLDTSISPTAETGMVEAILISGENDESDESQDAAQADVERKSPRRSPQNDPALQNGEKLDGRVLIIEDFPEVADVITAILRRMGLTTAHESHGVRAFERFNEMNPHIVLLDLALPDITGWKVLEAIKEQQRETDHLMPVVIVMTAYGDPANRLVGKLQGVHAYLIKPFTAEELSRVVRDALAQIH